MPIHVRSRRVKAATIEKGLDSPVILDVTSNGEEPWLRFSPFYPHGGIPVPFSPGVTAMSVEGIWQALKVFETAGIDESKFGITTMKGLKRTVRRFGRVLGHQRGVASNELIDYVAARKSIYLPTYRWVLDNRLTEQVNQLLGLANSKTIVLLDYETNADIADTRKPLSHASVVKRYLENDWPSD